MVTATRMFATLGLVTAFCSAGASVVAGQWTVSMRAMQNPLPVGQCTGIEITIVDDRGYAPVRPDQKQASGWDFDLDFIAASPDAFAWRDERHRFLCARAPTAASATVVARYPAQHLKPIEQVPGLALQQSIEVQMQGVPAGTPGLDAQSASPSASQPPVMPAPQRLPAQPTAEAQPAVKSVGGLFKSIGEHTKRKAGEVTRQTAQNIATGAEDVVDTSIETGAGVVSSAALEATSTARTTIGSAGRSLTPVALRGGESSDNLATVIAGGGAELRMLQFTGTTDVLEPASRDLIKRLAAAMNATQGNFVIEGHVDPLPSPAASQELSEHRAAAVKLALIRDGVAAARLKALGYGASEPKPEVPPGGGPPSSARIVVARE